MASLYEAAGGGEGLPAAGRGMDRRAIACFDQALEDVRPQLGEPLRQALHDYFAWATTTMMAQDQESADGVPAGLTIPRWSWDGLQR
ncbi:hypothetical protein [Frankia gtarii]|uniref:hypothetical protein n=1 Tax=Frankia gtarii TaxID=2950102 RepID=UPI0021BF8932|nr:hypothetical protein [Frankia gtarii]